MAIPESQLETWSHQGAITTSKTTADSLKTALNSYAGWPTGINFEVYLQGSYKNDTNIRGDSDVDVVAQLNSTFYSNLNDDQKSFLRQTVATYNWPDFKKDVLKALRDYYGQNQVIEGNKSVKLKAGNGRLPADVIVCAQYKKYRTVSDSDYVEGTYFRTTQNDTQVINFPKVHYDHGVTKHQTSNTWYKPTVRLFKNSRGSISGDSTRSYLLECLLYNVPNSKFGTSYGDTFCNIVNWLNSTNLDSFICQNGQLGLFGPSQEQWDTAQAKIFIGKLVSLWNSW